jgi:hypothetical protein
LLAEGGRCRRGRRNDRAARIDRGHVELRLQAPAIRPRQDEPIAYGGEVEVELGSRLGAHAHGRPLLTRFLGYEHGFDGPRCAPRLARAHDSERDAIAERGRLPRARAAHDLFRCSDLFPSRAERHRIDVGAVVLLDGPERQRALLKRHGFDPNDFALRLGKRRRATAKLATGTERERLDAVDSAGAVRTDDHESGRIELFRAATATRPHGDEADVTRCLGDTQRRTESLGAVADRDAVKAALAVGICADPDREGSGSRKTEVGTKRAAGHIREANGRERIGDRSAGLARAFRDPSRAVWRACVTRRACARHDEQQAENALH